MLVWNFFQMLKGKIKDIKIPGEYFLRFPSHTFFWETSMTRKNIKIFSKKTPWIGEF